MGCAWAGDGPAFTIEWGGRSWTLRTDVDRPGLYLTGRGPILGLAGLAARRRLDRNAFSGATLVACERHFDRIEATYLPPHWGELTLRAAWFPGAERAINLEIQVSARSVGELKAVEALVACDMGRSGPPACRVVTPRDRHCAGLSYDGREDPRDALETACLPRPGEVWPCWDWRRGGPVPDEPRVLLVMGRPEDVSRKLIDPSGPTVFALFGHDLERGVVLRGRLRALWLDLPKPGADDAEVAHRVQVPYAEFCSEPPPLTT